VQNRLDFWGDRNLGAARLENRADSRAFSKKNVNIHRPKR
jgi:hypothetical protein